MLKKSRNETRYNLNYYRYMYVDVCCVPVNKGDKIFNGHLFRSGFTLSLGKVTVDLDVAYSMKETKKMKEEQNTVNMCSCLYHISIGYIKPR